MYEVLERVDLLVDDEVAEHSRQPLGYCRALFKL
jgi:hypothetical protein